MSLASHTHPHSSSFNPQECHQLPPTHRSQFSHKGASQEHHNIKLSHVTLHTMRYVAVSSSFTSLPLRGTVFLLSTTYLHPLPLQVLWGERRQVLSVSSFVSSTVALPLLFPPAPSCSMGRVGDGASWSGDGLNNGSFVPSPSS